MDDRQQTTPADKLRTAFFGIAGWLIPVPALLLWGLVRLNSVMYP